MSPEITNPGVYIEEIPSGIKLIQEAPAGVTAFIGEATRGSRTKAIAVSSLSEFEKQFGRGSLLHTALFLFFENGGKRAVVVRLRDQSLKAFFQALHALNEFDEVSVLCLPSNLPLEVDKLVQAVTYCERTRAFLILDASPDWFDLATVTAGLQQWNIVSPNAAAYYPRLFGRGGVGLPACGAIAGVYARIDQSRGVWKAPAGTEADLRGVNELSAQVDSVTIQNLTQIHVNSLRQDTDTPPVIWGARTLAGNDNEWRYIPVRRMALLLERSIYDGTRWVVFEPNDEPLWQHLTASVEAFLTTFFQRGAFQGTTPAEAFFVKCDRTTMTPDDITAGVVHLLVGFAPLKPAEFIILKFRFQAALP